MSVSVLTGSDSVVLNNRVFSTLIDGNCAELSFANEIAAVKTGKDGNSIYALNQTGNQADFKLRIVRGASDDQFLNGLLASQQANFAGFPLIIGNFIKKLGDGQGNITSDTYILSGGVIMKNVDAKTNAEGDTDQSVSEWNLKFSNAPRALT